MGNYKLTLTLIHLKELLYVPAELLYDLLSDQRKKDRKIEIQKGRKK